MTAPQHAYVFTLTAEELKKTIRAETFEKGSPRSIRKNQKFFEKYADAFQPGDAVLELASGEGRNLTLSKNRSF